ncbi:hypothetical protein V2J09_017627 [Rumex salicifolius]
MAVPPTAGSGETVEKAVNALLKWRDSKSQKAQLLSSDDFFYLVVTLRKIPPQSRTNPYKLPLTHPLYSPDADCSELCLFLDDRPDRLPTSKDAKAKIAAESIPLPKVIKFSKLKTDYKPFEAKRKLCDSYDMFLADRRIIPLLPKHLGKHFYKKKKIPVPVDLEHKNWKEQVERLCSSAFLHLKTGTCSTVRVARSSMSPGDIADNVSAAINGVSETVPKKWRNIRSLHLKLSDSVALPIYQSLPEADLIAAEKEDTVAAAVVPEGKKRGREEGEAVYKSPKASFKKGRIHQVRYMDDKDRNDAVGKLDAGGKEEQVLAPKRSAKAKNDGVDDTVDGAQGGITAPKKSSKMKKGLNSKPVDAAEKEVEAAPKKPLFKTRMGLTSKAKGKNDAVDDTCVPKPKKSAKVKKEASKAELAEVDGAKIKKPKKVEVCKTDGAKVKKADKVKKKSGDAKTAWRN